MQSPFPWQQKQWQMLTTRYESNSFPHAVLFTGIAGTGKLSFAEALAKYMLCEEKNPKKPCSHCRSCQWYQAGTHPDLFFLQPEEEGKVIKVDQVRDLIEKLEKTSQTGNHQIVIIEPTENMNLAATNALLKTLEEPLGAVILLLVSHQAETLPVTLRIRCQKINFSCLPSNEIIQWIAAKANVSTSEAELLLALNEYAPLKALSFAEENNKTQRQDILSQLTQLISGTMSPLQLAAECKKGQIGHVIEWLKLVMLDIIRLKSGLSVASLQNKDYVPTLQLMEKKFSSSQLFRIIDKITETSRFLSMRIAFNETLLLEDVFITLFL